MSQKRAIFFEIAHIRNMLCCTGLIKEVTNCVLLCFELPDVRLRYVLDQNV